MWPLLLFWALAALFAHRTFGLQEVNLAVAIPYFVPGVMAYVGFNRRNAILPGWSFVLALVAVTWVGGHVRDWQQAWLPCLALGLILPWFKQLRPSLLTKVCWQIARYSYGIYLLHPFSLLLAFYFCRHRPWPLQYAVLFGSLAVFSVAAYHLIEAPCMRLGAKVAVAAARRFKMPEANGQSTV
jgi:peptidoglycan/LPS O-acetylase OafA/YrhL